MDKTLNRGRDLLLNTRVPIQSNRQQQFGAGTWISCRELYRLRLNAGWTSSANATTPTRTRPSSTSKLATTRETKLRMLSKYGWSMLPDESSTNTTSASFTHSTVVASSSIGFILFICLYAQSSSNK